MKKLLILLLISICAIGFRSEAVMKSLARIGAIHPAARTASVQDISSRDLIANDDSVKAHPMSVAEYAKLAKTDPDAYQKFLASRQVEEKRSEIDKLMNFLAHGKYE